MQTQRFFKQPSFRLILAGILLVSGAALAVTQIALARPTTVPDAQISPLHPTFMLLDEDGTSVLESGRGSLDHADVRGVPRYGLHRRAQLPRRCRAGGFQSIRGYCRFTTLG